MEQETPQEWAERFQRDVEEAAASPAIVERAVAEFDEWWRREAPEDLDDEAPASFQTEAINKELECSRREARLLREEIGRLKGGAGGPPAAGPEEPAWKERAQRLQEENERLRARQAALQGQFVEMRLKLSRAQADYEAEIERLTDKTALLEEQTRELKENRQFLQTEYARQCSQLARLEEELKSARGEALDCVSLRARLQERDAERSALEGALAELRGQAAALQERFLLGGRALDQGLARLQRPSREAEDRLLDTTRFLEDKLRAIQDETKEELGRLRELIDGLARIIQ